MANRMPIRGALTYGAAGSAFGSELKINVPASTVVYLSESNSVISAAGCIPTWAQITYAGDPLVNIQYTPDAGTTWRTVSTTLIYCDGSSTRLQAQGATAASVFFVPIKQ